MIEFWTTADNIPAVPGAYVLVISFMSRSWPALAESHQHPSLRANICTVARPEGPAVSGGVLPVTCATASQYTGTSTHGPNPEQCSEPGRFRAAANAIWLLAFRTCR